MMKKTSLLYFFCSSCSFALNKNLEQDLATVTMWKSNRFGELNSNLSVKGPYAFFVLKVKPIIKKAICKPALKVKSISKNLICKYCP